MALADPEYNPQITVPKSRYGSLTTPHNPRGGTVPRSDTVHGSGTHRRAFSALSGASSNSSRGGRPASFFPTQESTSRNVSLSSTTKASDPRVVSGYVESDLRWMERQEARRLRQALEEVDQLEDQRLHAAAQVEASELVWRHQNSNDVSTDPATAYRYTASHTQAVSNARRQSTGPISYSGVARATARDDSGETRRFQSPHYSADGDVFRDKPSSGEPLGPGTNQKVHELWDSPQKKAYMSLMMSNPPTDATSRRGSSGPKSRNASGNSTKGLFRNPEDQIYEEPEQEPERIKSPVPKKVATASASQSKARSPFSRAGRSQEVPARANTDPVAGFGKPDRPRKQAPLRSRNTGYTTDSLPSTPPRSDQDGNGNGMADRVTFKDGMEVRGEDIRAATSMKLKDRSPKLPSPSFVSDSPSRPIASFESDYNPKRLEKDRTARPQAKRESRGMMPEVRVGRAKEQREPSKSAVPSRSDAWNSASSRGQRPTPPIPTINVPDKPPIPSINVPEDPPVPSINVPDGPPIPSITVPDGPAPTIGEPASKRGGRPLPVPSGNSSRAFPRCSAQSSAASTTSRYSQASQRACASCAQCQLPISGRIVSAAGQRFHPECFICFNCGEGLECVAFYPEPEIKRSERLDRIRRRREGEDVEEVDGHGEAEDGDESLRFYCHLDFHEFFSPRCRSCKTPIEGEVVVACGGEWHVGHFFCAECGDPFDPTTPFVEKDGYAWCVNCHTNRFSTKCKKCRKPVTDQVVTALGAEWHTQCFCCVVSLRRSPCNDTWAGTDADTGVWR